jgi:hypothetical protein
VVGIGCSWSGLATISNTIIVVIVITNGCVQPGINIIIPGGTTTATIILILALTRTRKRRRSRKSGE